jgi:hypothetical protein
MPVYPGAQIIDFKMAERVGFERLMGSWTPQVADFRLPGVPTLP